MVTPGGSPWVSNEIVVLTLLVTITDGGDGVIEVGTARGGVKNTTSVHLEDGLIGLNGHGCWSLGNGSHKLGCGSWGDGLNGFDIDLTLGLGGSAWSISSGIWIVTSELLTGGLKILHGVGLPTTTATVTGVIAVNKLLLGKIKEGTSLDEMVGLNGWGGRESPAWTALSLVLDGVDGTLGSPVDGGGKVGGIQNFVFDGLVLESLESEELLVLEVGDGGELVVSNGEWGLLGIDLCDFGVLLGELSKSEVEFLVGSEWETEGGDVLEELWFEFSGEFLFTGEEADSGTVFADGLHFVVCNSNLINYKKNEIGRL
jgi:hypothetical protein